MALCHICGRTDINSNHLPKHQIACARTRRVKALEQAVVNLPPPVETEPDMQPEYDGLVPPIENETPIALDTTTGPGRPRRNRRLPARYRDELPDTTPPVLQPAPNAEEGSMQPNAVANSNVWCTKPDTFGTYRIYPNRPTHNPDGILSIHDFCESSSLRITNGQHPDEPPSSSLALPVSSTPSIDSLSWAPFLNPTTARLMTWFYSGSNQKSIAELDALVHEVILRNDFSRDDLLQFSTAREHARLDAGFESAAQLDISGDHSTLLSLANGWVNTSVKIRLPKGKVRCREDRAPEFTVTGVFIRPLVDVMNEAFKGPAFQQLHLTPFAHAWNPNLSPTTTIPAPIHPFDTLPAGHNFIYDEIYTSRQMMEYHCTLPSDPQFESVVAAFMFWSDSTHLASFGTASLWPLYTFFGNQSKYIRAKPTAHACHHQAYIPKLPDTLVDHYVEVLGGPPTSQVITHLKRELMHEVWRLLITEDFRIAYNRGVVIECHDKVKRRVFPRLLTYSADYPEKVLLATIRYLGKYPCPRCLIPKADIRMLGMQRDLSRRSRFQRRDSPDLQMIIESARRGIFERGLIVAGSGVDSYLGSKSLVPTRNAFSSLNEYGFNFYSLFVPDLLHEFELGVWKAVFTHLIRMLHFVGAEAISNLNSRFRRVPTFGQGTIRRFHSDAAAMKKLAGRDFEDLLQCSIPVFSRLFPNLSDDKFVSDLLFSLANWHSLAKLRMHDESTLQLLAQETTRMGHLLRRFTNVICPKYATQELSSEREARNRREQAKISKTKGKRKESTADQGPRAKSFNLSTYKLHALGDYVESIRRFGTSDSWSTQVGELEHRRVKRFYARTNKNNHTRQIAKLERRQRLLHEIKRRLDVDQPEVPIQSIEVDDPAVVVQEPIPQISPDVHHHMSHSQRTALILPVFLAKHKNDPAVKDFRLRLLAHLLSRLKGLPYDGDEYEFSSNELNSVRIVNDRLYIHHVLQVNYTSYDLRREQDSINPRTHSDVMVLSHENDTDNPHPYWYGRVIFIFHADILYQGTITRMDFLWVRWLGRAPGVQFSFEDKQLPIVGFVAKDETDASYAHCFGFLDPIEVIRGIHLIPVFAAGRTQDLLPPSIVRQPIENNSDWINYAVNVFVDRDMAMRYRGGGIGHTMLSRRIGNYQLEEDEDSDGDSSDTMDVDEAGGTNNSDGINSEDDHEVNEEGDDEDSYSDSTTEPEFSHAEGEDEGQMGDNEEYGTL